MKNAVAARLRFLSALPGYLKNPISYEDAVAVIRQRTATRNERFLSLVRRAVFENPQSPYLPLFDAAQCGFGDVESGVKKFGLEGFLKRLKSAGVWIAYDELKGRTPIRRGSVELEASDANFGNAATSGIETHTGGSSGAPTRSSLSLDFLASRACYDAVMFRMLGAYDAPLALWYPGLPAVTGVGNSLRYVKIGRTTEKWFRMPTGSATMEHRAAERAIAWLGRSAKHPLPRPEPLGFDETARIVEWVVETRQNHPRVIVQTYASQAARISLKASEMGARLDGTLFIVGSEPLTPAKRKAILEAGADVYERYHATEIGSIAMGCGSNPDELHVFTDTLAMLQDDETGTAAGPVYFTSFIDSAPKVIINASLGDTAVVGQGGCGCLLEDLGFDTRIRDVRSIERVTAGGMAVSRRLLSALAEEDLPRKFNGAAMDFQWVEGSGGDAQAGSITLRVSPAVGPLSEAKVIEFVLSRLERADGSHRFYAAMWRKAGAIRILREEPKTTISGKAPSIIPG
jgi:hypothetical protein